MTQGEQEEKTSTAQLYEMTDTQLSMAGTGGNRAEEWQTAPNWPRTRSPCPPDTGHG